MGVKMAGGLGVRDTVTGSGGSVGAAADSTGKTCSAVSLRAAFSMGFCFCLSLHSTHCCGVSALHSAKITCQSKRVGATVVFVLGFAVDGHLYALLCLSVQPWRLLLLVLTIQFLFYAFSMHTTNAAVGNIK